MADERTAIALAVDLAFEDHVKQLFADFVRHLKSSAIEEARREFRKNITIARQVRSEMTAIATEGLDARDVSSD